MREVLQDSIPTGFPSIELCRFGMLAATVCPCEAAGLVYTAPDSDWEESDAWPLSPLTDLEIAL